MTFFTLKGAVIMLQQYQKIMIAIDGPDEADLALKSGQRR